MKRRDFELWSMFVDICFFLGALLFIMYLIGEIRAAEKVSRDLRIKIEKGEAFESDKGLYRCALTLSRKALEE